MKDLTITQAFSRLKKMVPDKPVGFTTHVSCRLEYDRFSDHQEEILKGCYVASVGHTYSKTTWRDALDLMEQKVNPKMEGER